MRIAVMLGVAVPLAIADLVLKASESVPAWAYHDRSLGWVLLCCALLVALVLVTRVPALLVPPAAGLLAAGVLGNALSAAWNGLSVPNPIIVRGEDAVLAFNLADVWALVGILALFSVLATWLVRNRHLLPERRPVWARRRSD